VTKKIKRVRKTDYDRVVLTETCPYEVPIIFENVGIYSIFKIATGKIETEYGLTKTLIGAIINKDLSVFTTPMSYKIRKDSTSFRELSLLHPASQYETVKFYEEFQHKIIHLCSMSDFSIRAPKKIAGKYYKKNNAQMANEFKSDKMVDSKNEINYKHLTSYFSYHGYRRLYNFFDSYEFMLLERKFSVFWSLDISKCFDSIYTESINWSVQDKDFFKFNSDIKNTFSSVFSKLMETANYNDSSGILIGPEVSRIFAEIIFQKIDCNIKESLASKELEQGRDYEIRRYVDDIYLFTMSDSTSQIIHNTIEENVKEYKLSLNKAKTIKVNRPFVTKQTQTMMEVKSKLRSLEKRLIEKKISELKLFPKRLIKKNSITISFANAIKSLCLDDSASYTMSCNFLIKAMTNLIVRFCRKNKKREIESNQLTLFSDFFLVILDLTFHFFTVNPSHSGAIQLCKMTHFIVDFCDNKLADESALIKSQIHSKCLEFFQSSEFSKISRIYSDTTSIETLNILIVSSCLGKDYLLTQKELMSILNINTTRNLSYFEIIVLLYYIRRDEEYSLIYVRVINAIKEHLKDLSDIKTSTHKAYIFFEAIACPYIEYNEKVNFMICALENLNLSSSMTVGYDAIQIVEDLESLSFCGSWDKAAMMSLLEKKALQKGY
jgi:hypothetical protein